MLRRRYMMNNKKSNNYLTLEVRDLVGLNATISFSNECEYYIDGVWSTLAVGESITVNNKIQFRGNLTPTTDNGIGTFTITRANVVLSGNCMSMLFGDDADKHDSLEGYNYAFRNLFKGCKYLVEVDKGVLPATTLSKHCYSYMFYNCTKLTNTPDLPAINLADQCYSYMFYNCTSLVKAVDILPAMTMKTQCYHNMFRNCTALTTAPELPALELISNCYYAMFNKCTSLNYIKAMFLTTPSSTTTSGWVSSVSTSGTFVKNKNATWDVVGDNGIPAGWTVITE